MTVELTITPSDPSAGDTVHIRVHGEVTEPALVLGLGNAGDGTPGDEDGNVWRSPVFTQGTMPHGTGPSRYALDIDATGGDFTLSVYEYGDDPVETDPIYYSSDDEYAYPDAGDLAEALEAALEGLSVDVETDSETGRVTLLLGGVYSGRQVILLVDDSGLTGGGSSATLTQERNSAGPFEFGPLTIPAGDWTFDVVLEEDEEESLLEEPVELTVA